MGLRNIDKYNIWIKSQVLLVQAIVITYEKVWKITSDVIMVLLRACPILKLIQRMVHPDSRLRHGRFRNFPLSFTFLTDVRWTEILQEKRHFIRSNFGYPHLVTILTAYATWKWILKHFKNIILREHCEINLFVLSENKSTFIKILSPE